MSDESTVAVRPGELLAGLEPVPRLRAVWRLLRGRRNFVLLSRGGRDAPVDKRAAVRSPASRAGTTGAAPTTKIQVLLETWELDCCLPDLAVGDEWSVPLVSRELTVAPVTSTTRGLRLLDDGRVAFRGVAERHAEPDRAVDVGGSVVDVGVVRFYSQVGLVGWVSGTTALYHDRHGGVDVDDELVTVRGRVDSLAQGGRELETTADRRDGVIVVTLTLHARPPVPSTPQERREET